MGDFQTPISFARVILTFLKKLDIRAVTIIEPSCGIGSFILAASELYPGTTIIGRDINLAYIKTLSEEVRRLGLEERIDLKRSDFFTTDWNQVIQNTVDPLLVIGNPPWITSAELSAIKGKNVPKKSNFLNLSGIEAKTGKSNFDISEWMLLELVKNLNGTNATLAQLCKLSVARKVFHYCVLNNMQISQCAIYLIETKKIFGVNVKACLLLISFEPKSNTSTCMIFNGLDNQLIQEIGFFDNELIADIKNYRNYSHLRGTSDLVWRSGIKHDCVKVMELYKQNEHYINGFNEELTLEDNFLFPMLKSSDIAKTKVKYSNRWMIVTQHHTGEDTTAIMELAPKTWEYLQLHGDLLDKRSSSIYKNRPRFSIFGVGDYTFLPWKVAISGFYKELNFVLVGPIGDKPVVFDDTCYFLSFNNKVVASLVYILMNHKISKGFFQSFIFWDSKRPITKQVLMKLSIKNLIKHIGVNDLRKEFLKYFDEFSSKDFEEALKEIQ